MRYRYNRDCACSRCRAHGYMGPAVLITIGVLFLLDQMGHVHWMDFGYTWPALLIVIGLIKLLEHSASTYGHVPREYTRMQAGQPMPPGMYPPPGTAGYPPQPGPVPPQAPIVTPPSATPAGFIQPGPPPAGSGDKGGPNG